MPKPVDPVEQSAALAWRRKKKRGLEYLLVTSRDTGRWVLPKGYVADGHTPPSSAAKEAWEEAGIRGEIADREIGRYCYRKLEIKGGGTLNVAVFPLKVAELADSWPEKSQRTRKWMDPEAAAKAVAEPELKTLLAAFARQFAETD
ncbi:NUDIX hydrolase [Oceanibacterium hippocampi]|uniref:NUDIX domain protein n=1 Tax=Oceanibacterium hippocampi TaxID=745714 RepID=A0A1Y5SHL1_9PROT|nr:NUDIX hydrolase [Oceanibacterium hippocampi]SLN38029.1 NUDIX domain protein [Oceanibacterium hippocampi]